MSRQSPPLSAAQPHGASVVTATPQTSLSVPDTGWAMTLTKDIPFLTQNGHSVVCVGRHLNERMTG